MSRKSAFVSSEFWTSPEIRALPPLSKLLALYLITCKHGESAGAFHLPIAYICADLGMTVAQVRECLSDGYRMGFATYDDATEYVVVLKALKHKGKLSTPYVRHVVKVFDTIPRRSVAGLASAHALREHGQWIPPEDRDRLIAELEQGPVDKPMGIDTHGHTPPVTDTDTTTTSKSKADRGGADARPARPKKPPKAPKAPTRNPPPPPDEGVDTAADLPISAQVWESYSTAYHERYKVPPLRNTLINSQMVQFVKRVGKDDAPLVAAYYVSSNEQFYVRKMHPIGLMLADAEKLYTEWKSGKTAQEHGGANAVPPPAAWWTSDKGIEGKAHELKLQIRPGESYGQLRDRIREKLAAPHG
jgi:hypothetical protein